MGGLGYTPRLPLLFILGRDGREGNDWKNKTEEPSSDSVGTLFHWINMSLTRNTNATWSTSCKETKRPHTDWTWADSSSLNSQATCLSSDEECRSQTPLKEEMECCLAIIIIEKEHIASKSVVHLHLVRTIVDVVRMEQRIQRRTTIHEVAIAETQISLSRLHAVVKGTAQCIRRVLSPHVQRNRSLQWSRLHCWPLGILSCRFATPHSPHASTVHSCF